MLGMFMVSERKVFSLRIYFLQTRAHKICLISLKTIKIFYGIHMDWKKIDDLIIGKPFLAKEN